MAISVFFSKLFLVSTSVADPDPTFHFDADRDPTFHFIADPDPTFQSDADPESLFSRFDPSNDL
jgi:hypothetical protein